MRQSIIILILLLIIWIAGSSYWYVCKVRCDCRAGEEVPVATAGVGMEEKIAQAETEKDQALSAALEKAKNYLKNTGKLILYFKANSTITETNAVPEEFLKNLKLYLDNQSGSTVMVTGHADISGKKTENTELSRSRAEFVKDFLVRYGINGSQIQTSYKSDTEPEASNATPEGRSKNRRAEINVLI